MPLSQSQASKNFREKTKNEGVLPSGTDEDGNIIIVQPKRGLGSRMEGHKYEAIVRDLAEGHTILDVAEKYQVGSSLVQLLRKRHSDICPGHRQSMVTRMEQMREQLSESMQNDLKKGKMPPGVKPVAFGIVTDKYLAETGQNVQKHEHLHAVLPQDDVKTALSGLTGDKQPPEHTQNTEKTVEIDANVQEMHKNDTPGVSDKGGEGGHGQPRPEAATD